jgi:hypothetical protein
VDVQCGQVGRCEESVDGLWLEADETPGREYDLLSSAVTVGRIRLQMLTLRFPLLVSPVSALYEKPSTPVDVVEPAKEAPYVVTVSFFLLPSFKPD